MDKYYRHFKGKKYKLIAIAFDSETLSKVVVYQALYEDKKVWTRPYDMFFGMIERDGYSIPRFQEITKEEALNDLV